MYVHLSRVFFFYRIELNDLFVIRTLQDTEAQKVNFEIQKQRCCYCYSLMLQQPLLVLLCVVFMPYN